MSAAGWLRIKARAGRVLLVCLALSAVAGVLWYRQQAVGEPQQAPPGLPANNTKAEMVISDFRHVETRMDRTIWVLESARAEVFEDKVRLHTVKVTWFGEPGDITVVITSEGGTVDFKDRAAELHGGVRLERADGAVLQTEKIFWSERTKYLQVPVAVVITTPNFTFRGSKLDGYLETERIILRGRVEGEIKGGSLVVSPPS